MQTSQCTRRTLTCSLVFAFVLTVWSAVISSGPTVAEALASGQVNWPSYLNSASGGRFNASERGLNTNNVSHLKASWKASTGGAVYSSPAIANGIAYVGSLDGNLYAFRTSTGKMLWKASTGGFPIYSSPAVGNGKVYVVSYGPSGGKCCFSGNTVWAFDALSGHEINHASIRGYDGKYSISPIVSGDHVFVASDDESNTPAQQRKHSGLQVFNQNLELQMYGSDEVGAESFAPAVVGNVAYFGSRKSRVSAYRVGKDNTACPNTASSPHAATGVVPATRCWFTITTGHIFGSPAVVDGKVYVGGDDGKLYVFNASDGAYQWLGLTNGPIRSAVAVANGMVYVSSEDGKLYAFNANGCGYRSCLPVWTANVGYQSPPVDELKLDFISSPAVANGVVYVGSNNGKLLAFNAKTGKQLFSYQTGGPIYSSPAVVNGVVYFGSNDGKLYALHI